MFLSRPLATNFRKLLEADVSFHPALNVIVGENNSGKTALIDAIRSVLGERQFDEEDLSFDPKSTTYLSPITISATFAGLRLDDESAFLEALVPAEEPGTYNALIKVTATQRNDTIARELSIGTSLRGGAVFEVLQHRRVAYLPALRDPDSATGLRPGRQSQLAHLLRRVTNEDQRKELVKMASEANKNLKGHESVETARQLLRDNLLALSGPDYAQEPGLSFVQPEFQRIAGNLEAIAEDMRIGMNGLGASNLYYVAAVLADLIKDSSVRYRALLIEEPEAHLHPHYQILLLRFLKQTAKNEQHPVQVFVTTHSPILASQAASDGILPIVKRGSVHRSAPIPVDQNLPNATRVRQYLDATRSELFFARRILMVEGDAELLLLPALSNRIGIDLAERGVSVISAAGLNFKTFLPFIKGEILDVPVAIVTDMDPVVERNDNDTTHNDTADDDEPSDEQKGGAQKDEAAQPKVSDKDSSDYFKSLCRAVEGDPRVRIFGAQRTFESDLAIPTKNRRTLLDAMQTVRRNKTPQFEKGLNGLDQADFPELFYEEFFGAGGRTSKAEFAMALALLLSTEPQRAFTVPGYIVDAINHLLPAE